MRHRLYVHLTWTARQRAPLIDASRAEFLLRFLPAIARQARAYLLAIGLVTTHVHLVVRLNPATSIARLVQRSKGGSSILCARECHGLLSEPLRWDKGYNVESVSPRALTEVMDYVNHQPRRHPDQVIPGWSQRLLARTTSTSLKRQAAEPRL